jgi:hypothetical protein
MYISIFFGPYNDSSKHPSLALDLILINLQKKKTLTELKQGTISSPHSTT